MRSIKITNRLTATLAVMSLLACSESTQAQPSSTDDAQDDGAIWTPSAEDYPLDDLSGLGSAGVAKELCSAVFVTGDDPDVFLEGSAKFWMVPQDKEGLTYAINRDDKRVALTLANGVTAEALFVGADGCVVLGPDGQEPDFQREPLRTDVLDPSTKWPMGDRIDGADMPEGIDQDALARAVDQAFADDAYTLAFLVIHKGVLIAERYAPGITEETRLPGWSMTKTLQATLAGRLEKEGRLDLYTPVGLEEWSAKDDPRGQTTTADLLRMSAPIFCGNGDPQFDYDGWRREGYPFYLYTFSGPADAYAYSVGRPPLPEGKPRGYYANCQPHVLGRVLKDELATTDETIKSWAEEQLFAPLGMRSVVLENDRYGQPVTAGYSLATARDWARLGLLYAQDGVWQGERLLSKNFMSFVRSPAPHWEKPIYGGQVWLRQDDCTSWPCDTYQMNGIEGQRVMIAPSHDLVVVRLGRGAGDPPSSDPNRIRHALVALDAAGQELLTAIPSSRDPEAEAVEGGLKAFFAALKEGDRSAFDAAVTDDFTLYEDGEIWDAEKTFAVITEPPRWSRRWTLSQADVQVDGDRATVMYRNTLRATQGETLRVKEWLESAVLEKREDRWVVSFLQSTTIPQIQ